MTFETLLRRRHAGTAALCAFLLLQNASAESRVPREAETVEPSRLTSAVNDALGLEASVIASLDVDPSTPLSLNLEVPIDGELYTLHLARKSVRSAGYEVEVQVADGSYQTVEPGPVRTYRGTVDGIDGARVAASILEDGLHAVVLFPDGDRYWIEPIASHVATAEPTQHALYYDDQVLPSGGTCMIAESPDGIAVAAPSPAPQPGASWTENVAADRADASENDTWFAELGIDADYEFFLENGSVEGTEAQINAIINTINIQYERDVGIQHTITHLIIRTAEPDPYSSRGASTLLDQFRNHWYAAQSGIQRDVAHLFTGKELRNGIAGIAYITGLCSNIEGYSLVSSQALYCGAMACKTDLSAHELGHNWGAGHCTCPGWTMHALIQSANRFHPDYTVPKIVNYRDSRTCLFQGDEFVGVDITAGASTLAEGNTTQLAATALFLYGRDKDMTLDVVWSVSPPEFGSVGSGGVFEALEVEGEEFVTVYASYTFDGVERVGEIGLTITDRLAAPSPDSDYPDKVRYISMSIPPETGRSALRVVMTSLHHPVPDYAPGFPASDYSAYEGRDRWVGPVSTCTDREDPPTEFRCARLVCDPMYENDWGVGVIHVTDGEIVPSSVYHMEIIPAECEGNEETCPFKSAALEIKTQRAGDIVAPFQVPFGEPGTASQPNVLDVASGVDALKGTANAPPKMVVQHVADPAAPLTVIDIAHIVNAVKGLAYTRRGPCGCPPFHQCPYTDFCGRCVVP